MLATGERNVKSSPTGCSSTTCGPIPSTSYLSELMTFSFCASCRLFPKPVRFRDDEAWIALVYDRHRSRPRKRIPPLVRGGAYSGTHGDSGIPDGPAFPDTRRQSEISGDLRSREPRRTAHAQLPAHDWRW